MTTHYAAPVRVDLFTHIHKAIRKALFDLAIRAGSTDWTLDDDVAALALQWRAVTELLHSHTRHEDDYIFRLLDDVPTAASLPEEEHRDLDDLLAHLEEQFDRLRVDPNEREGLSWYRDLNRYIAATLQHLHDEETVVLPALWAACTDQELLECRATFLAATPPAVATTTAELLRAALPAATSAALGIAVDGADRSRRR